MRKMISTALFLALLLTCSAGAAARESGPAPLEVTILTGYDIDVYGEVFAHWSYGWSVDGSASLQYLPTLRSMAAIFSGSPIQFDVAWDQAAQSVYLTSGVPYQGDGTELTPPPEGTYTAVPAATPVYLDGERLELDGYLVEGRHCYAVKDVAAALGAETYLDREKSGLTLAIRPAGTLYAQALEDAKTVEPEEIFPLKTSLTRDNEYAVWNEAGDKVLVCTWNDTPAAYPDGGTVTAGDEPVWVFSGVELTDWYAEHVRYTYDEKSVEKRLCQLLGLPDDAGYTHFTTLWASPEDLYRPAYDPDPAKDDMTTALTGEDWFRDWFEANTAASYGADGYPWTRLGYTYDWGPGDTDYGLTEFILRPGAQAEVERTLTTQEYWSTLPEA